MSIVSHSDRIGPCTVQWQHVFRFCSFLHFCGYFLYICVISIKKRNQTEINPKQMQWSEEWKLLNIWHLLSFSCFSCVSAELQIKGELANFSRMSVHPIRMRVHIIFKYNTSNPNPNTFPFLFYIFWNKSSSHQFTYFFVVHRRVCSILWHVWIDSNRIESYRCAVCTHVTDWWDILMKCFWDTPSAIWLITMKLEFLSDYCYV